MRYAPLLNRSNTQKLLERTAPAPNSRRNWMRFTFWRAIRIRFSPSSPVQKRFPRFFFFSFFFFFSKYIIAINSKDHERILINCRWLYISRTFTHSWTRCFSSACTVVCVKVFRNSSAAAARWSPAGSWVQAYPSRVRCNHRGTKSRSRRSLRPPSPPWFSLTRVQIWRTWPSSNRPCRPPANTYWYLRANLHSLKLSFRLSYLRLNCESKAKQRNVFIIGSWGMAF